jgi:chemotaxis protein methyltransferase CheR
MAQVSIPALLPRFSQFLAQQMGLHFPPERWSDLMRGMVTAAREFRFADVDACMQWLLSTPLSQSQIEILASHLTVGETYFFREPQVFEALQTHILPALIASRRQSGIRLRIWSAACSTGEEAYSIAILLQQLIPDYKQWNITILGTDINPHALRKAVSGIYGEWSFRNTQPWLREKYFLPLVGGRYQIISQVQDMVTFAYLNLAEDAYPSLANNTNAMDIIFCRNVLMYFEPGLAAKVVRQHYQSLLDGGWLIVSPAEVSATLLAQLETVNFPGAALHRKNPAHAASTTAAKSPDDLPVIIDVAKTGTVAKPQVTRQKPDFIAALKAQSIPSPSAYYQQALTYYQQGHYTEATELIARLSANRNDSAQAMNLMVRIHANQGELATALHWCERLIAADRVNPAGYYLMAVILLEQGQPEEAMLALKRTLYLDPDFVLAHFTLGNLCRSHSRDKEAGKYFANTLSLLKVYSLEDVLPESEGMTAGRLIEIIRSITGKRVT